jgi:O-6-methylguanine DNA methyltransferase
MRVDYTIVETRLGAIGVAVTERGLCALAPAGDGRGALLALARRGRPGARPVEHAPGGALPPRLADAVAALDAYLGGAPRLDVPLDLAGTPFQLAVWRALAEVPFGETTTYAALAARLGRPTAARAVGAAVGANPVSLLVPCHRVVGARGDLTGFAWGLEMKRALLAHEGARPPRPA